MTSATHPIGAAKLAFFVLILTQIVVLIYISSHLDSHMTGDSARYLELASSLYEHGRFGLDESGRFVPEGWRLPGYPLFLALCRSIRPSLSFIILAQCGLYLIAILAILGMLLKAEASKSAIGFLLLAVMNPFVAYSACIISAEILASFFLAMTCYLFSKHSPINYLLAGVALGLSAYARPNLVFLGVVFAFALLVGKPKAYRNAFILLAVTLMAVFPWAIRNYRVFGRFTPLPVIQGTGVVLLSGTWGARVSTRALNEYGNMGLINDELQRSGLADQIAQINHQVGMPAETVFITLESYPSNERKMRVDALFLQAALKNMRAWPVDYLGNRLIHLIRIWLPFHLPPNLPGIVRIALIFMGGATLILGIYGSVLFFRKVQDRSLSLALIGLLLYFELTLAPVHTEARMTVPARLILLAFAGFALGHIYSAFLHRFRGTLRGEETAASPTSAGFGAESADFGFSAGITSLFSVKPLRNPQNSD